MNLWTLGPAGTFSHEAAVNLFPTAKIHFAQNFESLFDAAEKSGNTGLIPIENSLHGAVDEVLDLLLRSEVKIWKTYDVAVRHAFGAKNPKKVKRIASHHQALSQCRDFLRKHYPHVELFPVSSTSYAIELALEDETVGAIAMKKTMLERKLPVINEDIQRDHNTTRFGLLARKNPFPKEKKEHMSVALIPTEDRAGLLHDLLTPFKIYDVNLSRIESRPTGEKFGSYCFFLDFAGTKESARIQKLFEEIGKVATIKILGEW
ncbi:MAG: prephenate dehydratase domain-containing protein [Candidatus Peregrinibacteria bacterium]